MVKITSRQPFCFFFQHIHHSQNVNHFFTRNFGWLSNNLARVKQFFISTRVILIIHTYVRTYIRSFVFVIILCIVYIYFRFSIISWAMPGCHIVIVMLCQQDKIAPAADRKITSLASLFLLLSINVYFHFHFLFVCFFCSTAPNYWY